MSDHAKSPVKSYFAVWIALLVGTYLTYAVAKLDLGPYNAAVALVIATTKALLVALFFMHLKGASEKLLKLVVISTIFFLFILMALSMADYATRPNEGGRVTIAALRRSPGASRPASRTPR